jgi:hypothetical protein
MNFLVKCRWVVYGGAALGDLEREHGFRGGGGLCGWSEGDVSALDHEAGDEAVERCIIVCAACAQCEEVFCGLGDCFAEELDLEVALGGMELNGTMISTVLEIKLREKAQNLPKRPLTVTDMAVGVVAP